jgi:hypothetical protein
MNGLLCRLLGHGPFYQRVLYEGPHIKYGEGPRDSSGRVLSWPWCIRCGWQVITTKVVERASVQSDTRA